MKITTDSTITTLESPTAGVRQPNALPLRTVLRNYWTLTKPDVNLLIVIATFTGFVLGCPKQVNGFPFLRLVHSLLGTLLVASGTAALNQYLERNFDAQMRRTARRPLPAGRLNPSAALWFGILLSVAGGIELAIAANALASALALLTLVSYLFIYTPLKRKTPLCTLVGALPGAMPPLIGWAASAGRLNSEAWVLYSMLYLWQLPHFMAIAWMYRDDYDRAGYLVLPRGERRDRFVKWQSVLPALALVPLSLMPTLMGNAGPIYLAGALLLSSSFFYFGAQLAIHRSNPIARRLLFASIIYLPLVFGLVMISKT